MGDEVHHADRVFAVAQRSAGNQPSHPAVDQTIAASWQRCVVGHRLDPERIEPTTVLSGLELRHARDYAGRLLRSADPELDRLHQLVEGKGYSVLMTDRFGAIIARRVAGSEETGCRRWHLWTGAVWREDIEGTNGVGTCLAEGRPITVHRDQHFRRRYTGLSCTVSPLFNAMGQIAGVLDISSFRPDATGQILPLVAVAVREAAQRIEKRCFHAYFSNHLILALPEPADSPSVPLLALDADRRIVGATHAARQILGLDDDALGDSLTLEAVLCSAPSAPPSSDLAECAVIKGALAQTQGNISAAAAVLGVSRSTLHRKIRALNLTRHEQSEPPGADGQNSPPFPGNTVPPRNAPQNL